jgi:hypothetical protein
VTLAVPLAAALMSWAGGLNDASDEALPRCFTRCDIMI